MELTRTDAVFSKIAFVLFLCRNKSSWNDLKIHREYFWHEQKYWRKNQPRGTHLLSTRVEGAPPALWVLWTSTDLNSNSIYSRSGRKKIREKDSSGFMIRSRCRLLFFIGRADRLESGRGSGEGKTSSSSSSTILHHQFHDAHRRV